VWGGRGKEEWMEGRDVMGGNDVMRGVFGYMDWVG
jgi:hypothetical protein